ncbi:hypothetical protein [Geotoga petraea]|jgi:hypothetical protein|uniref:Uncharacterized protein n=1 Tax=Geotoga petraea TaxID=28234 RepID=A0A1G6Q409_9BACT|nr:hypothetical protein [Geotoga petraea]SDC87069.1 hypothetical protein SAMN04488588_1979 [Geotoga petraea]
MYSLLKKVSEYPKAKNTIIGYQKNKYINSIWKLISESRLKKEVKEDKPYFTKDTKHNIAKIYNDKNNNLRTTPDESLNNNLQKIKQHKTNYRFNLFK